MTTHFVFYDSLTSTSLSSAITQLSIFLSSPAVSLLIILPIFFLLFFSLVSVVLNTILRLFSSIILTILLYPSRRLLLLSQIYKTFCYTVSVYGISYYTSLTILHIKSSCTSSFYYPTNLFDVGI